MHYTTNGKPRQQIEVDDLVDEDYLALPKYALNGLSPKQTPVQLGPATQTLAAMLRLCDKQGEFYHSIATIADMACRSRRCVQRDLEMLKKLRAFKSRGREKVPHLGRRRRTNTLVLSKVALDNRSPFLQLPRICCPLLSRWSDRVVMAAVVSRHALISRFEEEGTSGCDRYSVQKLIEDSGLSRQSVIDAKHRLVEMGLIYVDGAEDGGATRRDQKGRLRSYVHRLGLEVGDD